MRIEHRSASRHITDEQSDLATEEKERRPKLCAIGNKSTLEQDKLRCRPRTGPARPNAD